MRARRHWRIRSLKSAPATTDNDPMSMKLPPPPACAPAARRHGARVALGLLLALFGGLAHATDDAATDATRVLTLESAGRAHPREAAAQLANLLAANPADRATRLEALTVQGWLLATVPLEQAAEAVARELDDWARRAAEPVASATALLVRARLAERSGNLRRAEPLIAEAVARLPADAAPRTRLRFVSAQASIKNSAGKLEDAVRLDHEALVLADALGDAWRQAEVRSSLAYSYFQAKQLDRARSLNAEALALAGAADDAYSLSRVHNTQGILLDAAGDIQGEKRSMQTAIGYARRAGAKAEEALYLANLADFYLKNGEYRTALETARQALPLTRELKNINGETVALANIGLAQIALHNVDEGKRFVRASIDIDERRGSLSGVSDSFAEMGQYLEKAGDLKGAIEALHQHRTLSDQLLQRSQQQAILEMQEQFDSDRRTRELALLQRDSQIKGEQLRAHGLEQTLWWLLAAGCLLSLTVVALLMRRVRHTNQRLASSNALLKVQSEIDPLTGLANRRHFQAAMRQLAADGKLNGTVFLADIDHFKRVNDCWGHATGDAVLVEVARRLRGMLREQDLIVRWGGEEFIVVVRALGPEAVEALAQRMLDVVGATPVQHEGRVIGTTVSIGYATFPIEPTLLAVSWERAIDLVDTALYLAKAHGRNRAYGVRMLHANDEAQLNAVGKSLEAAWRSGDVTLTHLHGPGNTELPEGEPLAHAA